MNCCFQANILAVNASSHRSITTNQLSTIAHHFLSKGADGLSLFNFAAFHKLFHRGSKLLPTEFHNGLRPDELRSITDKAALASLPRHYFIQPWFIEKLRLNPAFNRDGKLPIKMWEAQLKMYDWEDKYSSGILREYRDWETDRKSTRLNSSHSAKSRMPSSA